jgi:hypothetical protein
VATLVPPRLEVVGGRHRLEAVPLRRDRELDQLPRCELLS